MTTKRPRNPYILFNQEWGPVISDKIKLQGGTKADYKREIKKMWELMKENDTTKYQEYVARSKLESNTYSRRKKK